MIVKLSDPHTHINLHQVGNQIVVDFSDAGVPANLMRRYDATDYGTPVSGFDVTRVGNGSRIAITASGDFEQLAYQSDDQYVVEVSPKRRAANAADEKPVYTGERLTLNFQDIETRAVLQLLADASGQNIVVSDSVSGNVTLRLQNVPWDQALDIVLRTKGLDKRRQDNVIIVAPQAELAAREKAELAARKDVSRTRAAALGVPAGELRQGVRHGGADQGRRTTRCCPRAAASRSMSAPTRCCCRTSRSGSRTCAAWWRRSTSRCARC